MVPPEDDLSAEAQYTVFHPSEVELADTITAILEQVDASGIRGGWCSIRFRSCACWRAIL